MKDYLKKVITRKKKAIETLIERSNASNDINEVRSFGGQIDTLREEVREAETKLAELEQAESQASEQRGFNPLGTYGQTQRSDNADADGTNSVEYRTAFMNLVTRNVPIPTELRDNTLTSDVSSVIPTQLVAKIIEKMEHTGMILSRVTHTSFKGGVAIPIADLNPEAVWVGEGEGSDRQKGSTGSIVFAYHKLRCEISLSMEVSVMALSVFEAKFINKVAKAMVKAIEKAILNGSGVKQPKGIFKETGIDKAFASAVPTYDELLEIESEVPVEYEESAVWLMTKKQFFNIQKMVDKDGQPIARVTHGISGKPERTILGREVVLHPYAVEMGTLAGAVVDLDDYCFNTIYDLGIKQKEDWDTEDQLTKAVMSADGKLTTSASLIKVSVTA